MGRDLKTAFLLTAGIGSRLAPHTYKKPKPSLPFLSLPLMNYGFYLTQKSEFNDYLFNLHHLPQLMKKQVESLSPMMKAHHFLDEIKEILGSGGAIWNARHQLKDKDYFLIANGDEILIPEKDDVFNDLIYHFQNTGAICTLLTCDHPELLKSLKPLWVNSRNELLGFGKDPITPEALPQHYTGYKVFSKDIFKWLPEGNSHIFYEVLMKAVNEGILVNTFKVNCHWHETGDFESFVKASRSCLTDDLEYFKNVHRFYGHEMELLTDNDNLLFKPKDLSLPSEFEWKGVVCLGQNLSLGKSISLENVFVDNGAQVSSQAHLKNQFVLSD